MSADMTLPELVVACRASRDFAPVVAAIPYLSFLGLHVCERSGILLVSLPGDPKHTGNAMRKALHGGVIGAVLEATALLQLMAEDTVHVAKTIDITFDYLRSTRMDTLYAQARITRLGRRVANVHVEAWQEDQSKPVTTAHGHFLLT